MNRFDVLEKAFAKAGLIVQEAAESRWGNSDTFFCTVGPTKKGQAFFIWPGRKQNRVEVLGIDKKNRQLVLMVKEPKHSFVTRRYDRVTRKTVKQVVTVSAESRRFLLGFDERDTFMAQLPRPVTTVRQAHESLKAPALEHQDKYLRQGEWFFFPATEAEVLELEKMDLVIKKAGIGGSRHLGKPHVADEYYSYDEFMFVRGRVRHPDHATLKFNTWHRVVMNTEDRRPATGGMRGANWID